MSTFTKAFVYCNHFDKSAPAGSRCCEAQIEYIGTVAEVRRVAKAAGWTCVRSPLGAAFAKDYCPAHRPQTSQEG